MKSPLVPLLYSFALASVPVVATAAEPAAAAAPGKAAAALAGKLMVVEDGEAKDYALEGDPEIFIVYHSASW